MSYRTTKLSPTLATQIGVTLLLVITFAMIGFVALSMVIGNNLGAGSGINPYTSPQAMAAAAYPVGTPDPSQTISFESTILGFSLEYPRSWRKHEQGLRVMISPTTAGADLSQVDDAVLWFGMPIDGETEPGLLLSQVRAELASRSQILDSRPLRVGAESWFAQRIRFEDETAGAYIASMAATSKNEVGYYLVALAPAEQWDAIQPAFTSILGSFRFTTETVLKPTDATPPPTPTPTPTPVFYIIQSGDTPSHIAAMYGVTVEALMLRNGLDDPRALRTGAKLIIPQKRRR